MFQGSFCDKKQFYLDSYLPIPVPVLKELVEAVHLAD